MKGKNNWTTAIIQSPDRYAIPIMTHPGIEVQSSALITEFIILF